MAKETEDQKQMREMTEGIARNLSELTNGVKALMGGKLKKKAIYLLLAHTSGMSRSDVERVVDAIQNLEKDWVNK